MGVMVDQDDNPMPGEPTDVTEDVYAMAEPDPVSRRAPIVAEVVREDDAREDDAREDGLLGDGPLGDGLLGDGPVKKVPFQYSLADMFILTTGVALTFGVMSMLAWKWQYAAGLGGVGAFISVVLLTSYEPENKNVRAGCWVMLVFYVLTSLAAIITGR